MAYDAEGRLRQTVINNPSPIATTRNQLYDGVNMVADYDGADVLMRRYVHGPGVDEPLVVYEGAGTATNIWQYADHLGSIIGTADSTGTSTAIFTYGPFGESSLTTGIRYGYTGQRSMAALGLLYYKARFYSPSLGRFLQPDPIGYADDLNLYAYVGNNPVNFTDPSGLVRSDSVLLACAMSCSGMGSRLIAPPPSGAPGNGGIGGYDARTDTFTPRPESVLTRLYNLIFNQGADGARLPANPQDITNPPQAPPIPGDWVISPNPRRPGGIIATPPNVTPGSSDKGSEHIRVDPPGSSPVPGLEDGYWRWNRPGVGAYNPGRGNFGGTQGQTHVPLPPGYNIP